MGIFVKTPEEQAEKARQKQEEAQQRAQAEWLASPVGKATTAYERNQGFFQIELDLNQVTRSAGFTGGSTFTYDGFGVKQHRGAGHADVLSQIEAVGWRLEHANWVHIMTGQVSRDKFLSSGQEVGIMGVTVGVYLFRRVD